MVKMSFFDDGLDRLLTAEAEVEASSWRPSFPGRKPVRPGARLALAVAAAVVVAGLLSGCLRDLDQSAITAGNLVSPSFAALYDTPAADELPGELVVYFLDTGQSDAIYVRAPGGQVMVIDAGALSGQGRVVGFLTGRKQVSRVDVLVLSHAHEDHIGDALAILDELDVGTFYHSGYAHTTPAYEAILAEALELKDAGRLAVVLGRVGQTVDLGPAVTARFLHPTSDLGDEANEASLVLRVTYGSFSVVFTGDIGSPSEHAIIARGANLEATVLKVGHHGSSGSSSADFLAAVGPEVAVIEVGAGNDYGHPTKATLGRLADCGAVTFRTDRDGTIIIHSDGADWGLVAGSGD